MRRQLGEIIAAPVRKIDDSGFLNAASRSRVSRFQNVQPVAVEQESVLSEQFVQFGNRGVVVGKRLDFLSQEILRELNTLGSKARDLQLTREVLEMKSEIEKVREQVQNVE